MKTAMTLSIKWDAPSIEDWDAKFLGIPRSNILQSYDYACAQSLVMRQRPRWGIINIDGTEAGIVQILEARIFWNAVHAVILDRGPLWFEGYGTAFQVKDFFNVWNAQFPKRWGRRRRILPELADGPAIRKLLPQTGLIETGRAGYKTLWLDLNNDENTLRANMRPNWRGSLAKAEKAEIEGIWSLGAADLETIIGLYAADKAARGYGGPSPSFLKAYLPILAKRENLETGIVRTRDHQIAAFVVLAVHGRSATYLIGWVSAKAREFCAHHLLLWEGMRRLKQRGIMELDLGGISDDESGEGIRLFKEGMGGALFSSAGLYS